MKKFLYYYGVYRFCVMAHKLMHRDIPDIIEHFENKHSAKKNKQREVGFNSSDSNKPMARIGF